MAKAKVIYFNAYGRAEAIRQTLACAGVEFEDFRFEFEDWAALKPGNGCDPFQKRRFENITTLTKFSSKKKTFSFQRYLQTLGHVILNE